MKKAITKEEIQQYIKSRSVVSEKSGCWEWNRMRNKQGYGRIDYSTRAYKLYKVETAHRISYMAFKEHIKDPTILVRHRCNNKCCCNPEHLEAGTHSENMKDKKESIYDMSNAALVNRILNLELQRHNIDQKLLLAVSELRKREQ